MRLLINTLFFLVALNAATAQEKKIVGQKAENILVNEWLNTSDNLNHLPKQLKISSLKGRVIVLDFWFTRCAPCIASIPHLNKLSELYPEVVFLSISFDREADMNALLNKLLLKYPVGLDTSRTTINNYQVELYPETFVIDTNGIIRWQGSPFQLKNNYLNKLLNVERKSILSIQNREGDHLPDDILEFTYKVHDLEMGESAYSHNNAESIEILNQSLESILQNTFEINNSRIYKGDSTILKTHYDISLTLSAENAKDGNANERLKYLLPDALGFDFIAINVDTVLYKLIVKDSTKLEANKSTQTGSVAHWNKKKWNGKGVIIEDYLINFLENQYGILAQTEVKNDSRYDFNLPMDDFEKLLKVLSEDYGIELKEVQSETTLFNVVSKK